MITNEEVLTITQNVLGIMLELSPESECETTDLARGERAFTGCVHISGQWQGAVIVQASQGLGELFAGKFFEISPDKVLDDDIRDAVTELTNMIGGNIKGQVPGPSYLSIPSVTIGTDFDFQLPGTDAITEVSVCCHGHPLKITLCESRQ